MQDEPYTAAPALSRHGIGRGMSGRWLAATLAAALLIGAAGTAWISWHYGWLKIDGGWLGEAQPPSLPVAALPAPAVVSPGTVTKLAALETRITQLDAEADAASSKAGRAESLLIAFAARRAIERGQPLGYLENQLRLRFGGSQPQSVDRIVQASTRPVTLDWLSEQLTVIEPRLSQAAPDEGTWDWISREASDLFIIRHQDSPSPDPARRMGRARQYLAGGRVAAAMDEVQRMPGSAVAKDWLDKAASYVLTEKALDIVENAAVLQPEALPANQPPPVPIASASPAASPTP